MIANMIHLESEEKDGGATLYKMYLFIPQSGVSIGLGGGVFTKNVGQNWAIEREHGYIYLRCPWFAVFGCFGVY
jgi:hypothetical protein